MSTGKTYGLMKKKRKRNYLKDKGCLVYDDCWLYDSTNYIMLTECIYKRKIDRDSALSDRVHNAGDYYFL